LEHFAIVLGLCRAAAQAENPAVRGHIQRLVKALEKDGNSVQVEALNKILSAELNSFEIAPSRVVLSRATLSGESLTPSVPAPVDKETGAPLAQILHPEQLQSARPLFNINLSTGVNSMLEEWRHVDELKAAGVRPALATMLFGAPGTGKTMLAHYISGQLGLPLIVARLDGLISSFLGTTARNISNLFAFANRYKCVLLLDEFDAIAKLRDDPHELGEIKRVVNTLLQCIDSRSQIGFTIAITNHESLLDPAIWRRFDIRIEVPKPNVETRTEILRHYLGHEVSEEATLKFLSWLTEGGSGSDIQKLTDFLKRQKTIKKDNFDFLNTVQSYIQLSAHEDESKNRLHAIADNEQLAVTLASDLENPFNQEQLAKIFNNRQSTISRWLNKDKNTKGDING
jgi:MoxR-like ATPase